jgi:alpha-tubulin suppressor-like RCC1 family protein
MTYPRFFYLAALCLGAAACSQTPIPNNSPKPLGVLEVRFSQDGYASAKLERPLKTQTVTFRETDLTLGTGITQVITPTDSAYTYLVASFAITNTSSSQVFQNLTLYALAKSGNLGNTAFKSISNWGGIINPTEQIRQAKLAIPVSPVLSNLAIDTFGGFQAFTSAEVTAATNAATTAGAMTAGDTLLNYGFNARCTTSCVLSSRQIGVGGAGVLKVAMRVPKSASVYGFVMNFLVFDESVSRVTRSVFPSESIAAAETRGTGVTASRLMQFGLNRGTTSLTPDVVDDVFTSTLNTSIHALGIGRISAGNSHSCGLGSTGQAYCWGRGTEGQLGNSPISSTTTPSPVSGGHTFSSISAGQSHTCGLTTAGAAYCWGNDFRGQLGDGATTTGSATPSPVSGGHIFSSISAGQSHTCAVTTAGVAYCWGFDEFGQLGDDTLTATGSSSTTPSLVSAAFNFSSISAGQFHTCGLNLAGKAYCWGSDGAGQLGDNTLTTAGSTTPTPVDGGFSFSSISAGGLHSCGVTTSGAAYCWGADTDGQLGNGAPTIAFFAPSAVAGGHTFSSIEAGSNHNCALTTAGVAYCWGADTDGQLGDGATTTGATTPSAVANGFTYSSISAGGLHSCGVTTSGAAYCWGADASGQLGDGTTSTGTTAPSAVDNTNFTL